MDIPDRLVDILWSESKNHGYFITYCVRNVMPVVYDGVFSVDVELEIFL